MIKKIYNRFSVRFPWYRDPWMKTFCKNEAKIENNPTNHVLLIIKYEYTGSYDIKEWLDGN